MRGTHEYGTEGMIVRGTLASDREFEYAFVIVFAGKRPLETDRPLSSGRQVAHIPEIRAVGRWRVGSSKGEAERIFNPQKKVLHR